MVFRVRLTYEAERDLRNLVGYLAATRGPDDAEQLLGQIERILLSLGDSPERGRYPAELLELGIREYREVQAKPYRIVYRVVAEDVFVLVIADGRRDLQSLLVRRLLSG